MIFWDASKHKQKTLALMDPSSIGFRFFDRKSTRTRIQNTLRVSSFLHSLTSDALLDTLKELLARSSFRSWWGSLLDLLSPSTGIANTEPQSTEENGVYYAAVRVWINDEIEQNGPRQRTTDYIYITDAGTYNQTSRIRKNYLTK